MKKEKRLFLSLLSSAQILGVAAPLMLLQPIQVHATNEGEGDVVTVIPDFEEEVDEETLKERQERIAELLEDSQSIASQGDIQRAIDKFGELDVGIQDVSQNKDILAIHNNIVEANNKHGNGKLTVRYLNILFLSFANGPDSYDVLIKDLINKNKHTDTSKEIDRVMEIYDLYRIRIFNGGADGIEVSIEGGQLRVPVIEDALKYSKEESKNPITVPKWEQDVTENNKPNTGSSSATTGGSVVDFGQNTEKTHGSYYVFDAEKGQRILVEYTIQIVDGKRVRDEKRTVEASGLTSLWSDRLSGFISGTGGITATEPAYGSGEELQDEEKKTHTLQYTVNKNDTYPLYVDTGIFVDTDGFADYDDLYNVLYQIAINADEGYLVEDTNKLLIIVEGSPVYITDKKEKYSQKEIESIFKSFDTIDLLVKETRIGTTESLEWQLKTGIEQHVLIDNEEIKLTTQPNIRESMVVLPIVEIFENIGALVTEDDEKIVVEYDEKIITFENGVKDAHFNGELIDLVVPVTNNDRGIYTANITPVLEKLGIEVVWDEQESTLLLTNTMREEYLKRLKEEEEVEENTDDNPDNQEIEEEVEEE